MTWNIRYLNPTKARNNAVNVISKAANKEATNEAELTLLFLKFNLEQDTSIISKLEEFKISITESDKLNRCRLFTLESMIFDFLGDYENALNAINNAEEALAKDNESEEKSDCLATRATLYSRINRHDDAIQCFEKSLDIRLKSNNSASIASTYNQLARTYFLQGKIELAVINYQKSLDIREQNNDKIGITWTQLGLGTVYSAQNNTKQALEILESARKNNSDSRFQMTVLLELGKIYLKTRIFDKAEMTIEKATTIANELSSKPNLLASLRLKSELAEAIGNFEHALELRKKAEIINTEIHGEEILKEVSRLEIAHQTKELKQQQEIDQLKNVALAGALKEIHDSIAYAKRIQKAVLPSSKKWKALLPQSFVYFNPKESVSGDFTFLESYDGNLFFAAADCTGHGVPGALVSMICHDALLKAIREFKLVKPGEILEKTSEIVADTFKGSNEEIKDGMDISLCTRDRHGIWNWAGANNSIYIVSSKEWPQETKSTIEYKGSLLHELAPTKRPVGQSENIASFVTKTLYLNEGDEVFLFSDGYADQFGGPRGKKLKYKPFKEMLISVSEESMENQKRILHENFETWRGDLEQIDDVCVIGFRV